jgi:hypothetical protein
MRAGLPAVLRLAGPFTHPCVRPAAASQAREPRFAFRTPSVATASLRRPASLADRPGRSCPGVRWHAARPCGKPLRASPLRGRHQVAFTPLNGVVSKAQKVSHGAAMGVTHALRGLPRMATQGLGGAWTAQPNGTHASNGWPLTAAPGLREAGQRSATAVRRSGKQMTLRPLDQIGAAVISQERRPQDCTVPDARK